MSASGSVPFLSLTSSARSSTFFTSRSVRCVPDGDGYGDGHAALACGAEGPGGEAVSPVVQVRVGHDEGVDLRRAPRPGPACHVRSQLR